MCHPEIRHKRNNLSRNIGLPVRATPISDLNSESDSEVSTVEAPDCLGESPDTLLKRGR